MWKFQAIKPQNEREQKKANLLLTLFDAGINWLHDSSSTLGKESNKNKPVLCGQVIIAEILELFSVQVRSAKGFLGMGQGNISQGSNFLSDNLKKHVQTSEM